MTSPIKIEEAGGSSIHRRWYRDVSESLPDIYGLPLAIHRSEIAKAREK